MELLTVSKCLWQLGSNFPHEATERDRGAIQCPSSDHPDTSSYRRSVVDAVGTYRVREPRDAKIILELFTVAQLFQVQHIVLDNP